MTTACGQTELSCMALTSRAMCCWPAASVAYPGCSLSSPIGWNALRVGWIGRKHRVHGVAVRCDLRVLSRAGDQDAVGVELRHHVPRRLRPVGRTNGDQPHVVEPRAAKNGMAEVVAKSVLA